MNHKIYRTQMWCFWRIRVMLYGHSYEQKFGQCPLPQMLDPPLSSRRTGKWLGLLCRARYKGRSGHRLMLWILAAREDQQCLNFTYNYEYNIMKCCWPVMPDTEECVFQKQNKELEHICINKPRNKHKTILRPIFSTEPNKIPQWLTCYFRCI